MGLGGAGFEPKNPKSPPLVAEVALSAFGSDATGAGFATTTAAGFVTAGAAFVTTGACLAIAGTGFATTTGFTVAGGAATAETFGASAGLEAEPKSPKKEPEEDSLTGLETAGGSFATTAAAFATAAFGASTGTGFGFGAAGAVNKPPNTPPEGAGGGGGSTLGVTGTAFTTGFDLTGAGVEAADCDPNKPNKPEDTTLAS